MSTVDEQADPGALVLGIGHSAMERWELLTGRPVPGLAAVQQ